MQAVLSIIIIIFFPLIIPNLSIHISHLPGNETDQHALLAIKSNLQDPNLVLSSWNKSVPLCQWRGVTCGRRHSRVVGLDLPSNGLVGTLSPFVGNLSFLRMLILYNNTFLGSIPPQIGHLSRLRVLYLANNSFEGEIPSNLSHCMHLTRIILYNNKLFGRIPNELSYLPNLKRLWLSKNKLSGQLKEIGITNMTSLELLGLDRNDLEGSIPENIGHLKRLKVLQLYENRLSGMIPLSMYNISSLETLDLYGIGVHGKLPQDLGLSFPNLQYLNIGSNYLSGYVPKTLSNLSKLETIVLLNNNFSGKFLFSGKNMQKLQSLVMDYAFTEGDESNDMKFIETLTNCSSLRVLEASNNNFGGNLPSAIVNLSKSMEDISLSDNRITGSLSLGMSKFVNLQILSLSRNQFIGSIPAEFGGLVSLDNVYLDSNFFSRNIPSTLGNLSRLSCLYLHDNNLEGNIPSSLGNCKYLLYLHLSENNISGMLPLELFHASELVMLGIDQNNLQGPLPLQISNLKNMVFLDVSHNLFSGQIPSTLDSCTSLLELDMGYNSFSGSIPLSLSSLKGIQHLNLTHNNLSGQIPSYISNFTLISLDLSFNNFEGEVPVTGIFSNTTIVSLVHNRNLCGGVSQLHLPRCSSQRESKRRKVSFKIIKIIIIVTASIVLTATLVLTFLFYFLNSRRKKKNASSESLDITAFLEVSYHMLWEATEGFSPSNLVGVGGYGLVYKGIIRHDDEEMKVAIKVMNLQNETTNKSFMAECNALRNIRHRNLVKIITACSSIDHKGNDFKALVYEFMQKGSLENWLHSVGDNNQPHCLSLLQRLDIAIDIACAIDYLHNECPTPIIHCDLKPSNILLDDDFTAHVSDFGIAKFLLGSSSNGDQTLSSQVKGTIGYIPPEYGVGSKVSVEGDIYSFGVIILEMMTTKKPIDPTLNDGVSLHDFAKSTLPGQVMEIIDPKLFDDGRMWLGRNGDEIRKIECLKLLINIGVCCSLELPQERMHIKDVVNQLKSTKQTFFQRRI